MRRRLGRNTRLSATERCVHGARIAIEHASAALTQAAAENAPHGAVPAQCRLSGPGSGARASDIHGVLVVENAGFFKVVVVASGVGRDGAVVDVQGFLGQRADEVDVVRAPGRAPQRS